MPLMSLSIVDKKSLETSGIVVESFKCEPAIISKIFALSLTLRVIGPMQSKLEAKAINP